MSSIWGIFLLNRDFINIAPFSALVRIILIDVLYLSIKCGRIGKIFLCDYIENVSARNYRSREIGESEIPIVSSVSMFQKHGRSRQLALDLRDSDYRNMVYIWCPLLHLAMSRGRYPFYFGIQVAPIYLARIDWRTGTSGRFALWPPHRATPEISARSRSSHRFHGHSETSPANYEYGDYHNIAYPTPFWLEINRFYISSRPLSILLNRMDALALLRRVSPPI